MKNLFTNLMKNTAKRTQNTGGGASRHEALIIAEQFSQSQTSRSEGARQITARFESVQMKNTSLISGCSAVDVPMTSYGASDEHPMSIRSASDERRWKNRGWKHVAMIFAVLTLSIANICMAWGTDLEIPLTNLSKFPLDYGLVTITNTNKTTISNPNLTVKKETAKFKVETISGFYIKSISFTDANPTKNGGFTCDENASYMAGPTENVYTYTAPNATTSEANFTLIGSGGTAQIGTIIITVSTSNQVERLTAFGSISSNKIPFTSSAATTSIELSVPTSNGVSISTNKISIATSAKHLIVSTKNHEKIKYIAIPKYQQSTNAISGSSDPTGTYSSDGWTPSSSNVESVDLSLTASGGTTYSQEIFVVYTSGGGCTSITPTWSTDYSSTTLNVGATSSTPVVGKDGSSGAVTFSSSATDIATVNSSGVVTGVGAGTATITATVAADGGKCEGTVTKEFTIKAGVTYDANSATGGSEPTDANTYAYNANITVAGNTGSLYKTGFVFNGWNTRSDGTGTHYEAGATMKMPSKSTGVTLYAEWVGYATSWEWWNSGQSDGSKTFTYLTNKNYICSFKSSNDAAVASWDMEGGEYFRGIKIKTKDHYMYFWVQAGKRVSITFGTRPIKPTFTVGGVDKSSEVGASTNSDSITVPYTTTADTKFYIENETATKTAFTVKSVKIEDAASLLSTTNPSSASYVKGASATALSVTASGGTTPYSYQWYSCDDALKTNPSTVGTNSASYTPGTTATGSGYYYCTVTDAVSANVSSAVATVTIRNAAAPTASPAAGAVASETEITLTSSDGGTIYYTTDGTTPTDASTAYDAGAKPAITAATTIKAAAKVNGYLGDVMTASYTISAVPVLTALVPGTRYDVADMVPDGTTITSTDQFVDGLSENTKFELIGTGSGATGSTMKVKNDAKTVDDIEFANSYYFGTGATLSSNTPTDYAIKFIVPSAGTITAWLRNSSAIKLAKEGVAGTVFGSGNSSTYNKYTLTVASSGTYYIYATGGSTTLYGLKFLANATAYSVGVNETSVCAGGSATITLSGSQSGVNYQLYKGESTVGDAKAGTGYALSWTGIDAAGTYTIKSVANASYNATAMSGSVTISILTATAISTQPTEPIVVTLGDAAEIAITATGEGDLTYEWYTCNSDGTGATKIEADGELLFSGYTTATLGLTPNAAGSTYYKCTVTGTCGSATTNVIEVQAAEQYNITHTLSNIIKVSGEAKATAGGNYTAVYRRTVGYTLPAAVTVTRGETNITALCTWTSSTGTLTIPSAQITGDITITVTGTAVSCPNASSTETLFLYEPKTSLSDADIPAGTYTFYDAAPGDYLKSVSGGFVTLYVNENAKIRIRNSELSFDGGESYVKIDLDCGLQAKDRILVGSAANKGNLNITLAPSNKATVVAEIEQGTAYRIPAGSDLIGVSTIYFWRKSASTNIGQVQIVRPETAYDITTSATNGTITTQVSGAAVVDAVKDAQVDISATGSTGYQFSSWSIYKTDDAGTTVTPNAATASTYFTMPQYDVTVSATFSLIDYTVTHNAATNGSYTIKVGGGSPFSTNTTANYGQTVTLDASPADGYAFSSWTVTGATSSDNIEVDGNNQFVMPAEAVTISASFAKLYTVSAGSSTNGSITITPSEAVAGTTISIAATGDLSYVFSSWTIVDGESTDLTSTLLGANSTTASTSFTMPAYDVTVSAAFEVDNTDYTVSFSAGTGGGTVPESESGKIGSSFTVPGVGSMTAPTSKVFKGWLSGDDVFYPSGTTYTITGNATLTAVWDGNGSSVTITHFQTSSSSKSSNKPDDAGYYFYGYKSSVLEASNALTFTTNNNNTKGANSNADVQFKYNSYMRIYSNNTTTGGTPTTFNNVTAVSLKIKLRKKAPTISITIGNTTVASSVDLSEASDSEYKLYSFNNLSNLSGIITITNTSPSGSVDYDVYLDDITITCGVLATGKTVTFDNQTGFNGTTTLPDDIEGIPSGSKILRPETDPSAAGYTFGGWYKEAACTNAWDFDTDEVDNDITLYAKWEPILLTAVSIDNLDLNVGFSDTPVVTKTPADALASAVWSIVDGESYISIDSETGLVTATAPGTAHVKVVMTNSNSAEITSNNATVTVTYASLSSITISPAEVTMAEETSQTLTATFNTGVDPSTVVTWTSSDSNVASVTSEGVVTAHKEGTATITCKATATPSIYGESEITVENVSSTGQTVTFTLGPINSADASLDTTATASSVPAILINRSNIDYTRVELASSPTKSSNRTAKLKTPTAKDDNKYVELRFDVASGYTFNPTNVAVIVANVNDTTAFDFELADNNYSVTASCLYSTATTGDTRATVNMPNTDESKKMTGTVSLKIWPYGYSTNNTNDAAAFRFGNQIVITGNVQAAYADAIYKDGAWKYGRTPDENRAVQITENITITTSTTITAKSVELDENVQMTVEAGAALVVAGQITVNGSAPTASNLILGSDAEHGNGTLIFNNSNHAAATVQMYSKAAIVGSTWNWQYIGSPFLSANALYNYYGSYMYKWNAGWKVVENGANVDPWVGYSITYETANTYVMEGTLVETSTIDLTVPAKPSTVFANSWTAPIYIPAMADALAAAGGESTVYLFNTGYNPDGVSMAGGDRYAAGTYLSVPCSSAELIETPFIASMQGFLVKNTTSLEKTLTLDYNTMVRPTTDRSVVGGPMHAPRRGTEEAIDEPEVLKLTVSGTNYDDVLYLLEHESFNTGFDNGWDGTKMGSNAVAPRMYTKRDDGVKEAVSAVPDLEGKVINFRAGEDDIYTFHFMYGGNAEALYLYDVDTQEYTRVLTGNTYTFKAEDKVEHDRFILTRYAPQMPTGVENVQSDDVQSTKVRKLMIDGVLYIIRSGRIYSAEGMLVK